MSYYGMAIVFALATTSSEPATIDVDCRRSCSSPHFRLWRAGLRAGTAMSPMGRHKKRGKSDAQSARRSNAGSKTGSSRGRPAQRPAAASARSPSPCRRKTRQASPSPSRPGGSAATSSSSVKRCGFLCGACQTDSDPLCPREQIRWGYTDNQGATCYYCQRAYAVKKAHTHPDREDYMNKLSTDKDEHDSFHGLRKGFITRRQNGFKQGFAREGGALVYLVAAIPNQIGSYGDIREHEARDP